MLARPLPKILIVEDVEGMLKILEEMFFREGFSVCLARDGYEGLNECLKELPQVILSDVLMPQLDGLEMVRRLREDERTRRIPVFFLSVLREEEYNHRLASLPGVVEVIWKNETSLDEIVRKVKNYLRVS